MKMRITFKVNGNPVEVFAEPNTLLVEVLRDKLGMTGTKRGCSDSSCGACTIIMNGYSVKSCSVLAPQAEGAEITTVEGLAQGPKLTPIQKAFLDEGAFQCGFCTSGMLMSSQAFIGETKGTPTEMQIRESIEGNICRCTGYNSIVRAIDAVIKGKYAEGK